jgi:hypothetical protein
MDEHKRSSDRACKANRTDAFFHPELVMQIAGADDVQRARFDVVLAMK